MTEQEHGLILKLLQEVDGKVDGINGRLDVQNGRVRRCENAIAVLQWALYVAGSGIVAGLAYLYVMHLR